MALLAVSPDDLAALLDGSHVDVSSRHSTKSLLGQLPEPVQLSSALDAIDVRYEHSPSAALLAEAGRCHAAVTMLLDGVAVRRIEALHRLATRSAILLSQLVWDAAGRRDHQAALQYCAAASDHAEACGDALADAHIELRRTYIALYSVGRRPDPVSALAVAEAARDKSRPISKTLCGVAELHVAEALALAGEYRLCERALGRAKANFERQRDDDPAIESFAPSQLGRMAGSCYLFLGAPERALPLLSRTADELADRPKTRSLVLGNVALGHLRQREIDAACGRLHEAIDLIEQNRGGGGMSVAFAAARELYPWRGDQLVQDVNDRLLGLLARG
jgi:hypothetical protein